MSALGRPKRGLPLGGTTRSFIPPLGLCLSNAPVNPSTSAGRTDALVFAVLDQ
jgi:hypothetical protein